MAHLYISAAHKTSGKTTISIGLCRELRRRDLTVQPFKKGPDYIDPLWLSQASGRTCLNLDFHTMAREEIRDAFAGEMGGADIGVIEGNLGLFDAVDLHGSNSNAELAKHLQAPVILIIDAEGMTRGVAPLLLGYQTFDPTIAIAGIVLNRVGGMRHEANLRRIVEHYTDIPLLGLVHRDSGIEIAQRHLGLMPSNEDQAAEPHIEAIRSQVAEQVDVDGILAIAARAPSLTALGGPGSEPHDLVLPRVRIGIARDQAFGFYYPDDLRALAREGAELVPFSPCEDPELPAVDGLFIGGGFPEYRMKALEANRTMRASIADFIASGGAAYAECGGLMYLATELRWGDDRCAMCGVLDADVAMYPRPQGRGYVILRETPQAPWPRAGTSPGDIMAHEFHHSAVVAPNSGWTYAYRVTRGSGVDGSHDGIVQGNLLASYAHLRGVGGMRWPARFVAHVRACRNP
ncbi:MAG: cobyrinate a,c-diamide synthase [Bdellovibrio bacteriovorus]